jgi:hypothetical protein
MPVFTYKIPRKKRVSIPAGSAQKQDEGEVLSGQIQGQAASDIEERCARALDKDDRIFGYTFREAVISRRNLPGQLEVDFVVYSGSLIYPIQVDGEFAHKGTGKKAEDALKDAMVNNYFKQYGAQPVLRIDGDKLADQSSADKLVKELL